MRSKVDTEMDDHTKADIFTNQLKKYMKIMNELEEQNFASLLKRVMSKYDLNALLFGENTEIVSDEKLKENQAIARINAGKHKSNARSQESKYMKKLRVNVNEEMDFVEKIRRVVTSSWFIFFLSCNGLYLILEV